MPLPIISPHRISPRASVPIPQSGSSGNNNNINNLSVDGSGSGSGSGSGGQQPKRKKSKVLQSSLDIVFSYSRSQQNRYGAFHSAPSFVDGSARSWSSPEAFASRRRRWDVENGLDSGQVTGDVSEEDELEEGDFYEEDEDGQNEEEEDSLEGNRRRSSAAPSMFASDPIRLSPADETHQNQQRNQSTRDSNQQQQQGGGGGAEEGTISAEASAIASAVGISRNNTKIKGHRSASESLGSGSIDGNQVIRPNLFELVRSSSRRINTTTTNNNNNNNINNTGSGSTNNYISNLPETIQDDTSDIRVPGSTEIPSSPTGTGRQTERTPLLSTHFAMDQNQSHDPITGGGDYGSGTGARRRSSGGGGGTSRRPSAVGSPTGGKKRRLSGVRRRIPPDIGQSTNGQTLFNAIAVLVGLGILSLPLAFSYAGWIGGTIMLLGFGYITCYTAKLLARLILSDRSLLGYTDIGRRAFGGWASGAINLLFCLELFAFGVALIVLFGDSLEAIFPHVSSNNFKILGFFIVLPTTLLPLWILSLPSLISTLSSMLLVLLILVDGFGRTKAPGSLLHPQPTNFGPEWTNANCLGGIGLILAGFGGHAVVPGLARDMKKPEQFEKVINKAFFIACLISFVAGAAGYLMIGNDVSDEITRDLMQPKYNYPRLLNLIALWMIVVNPVTKFGLCSRPLNVTIETLLGINPTTPGDESQIVSSGLGQLTEEDETIQPLFDADHDHDHNQRLDDLDLGLGMSPAQIPPNQKSDSKHLSPNLPSSPGEMSVTPNQRIRSGSITASRSRSNSPSKMMSKSSHRSPSTPSGARPRRVSIPTARDKRRTIYRIISRIVVTAICTATAIGLPGFGRVMAFLGSFSAFLICIILPLLFHLRLAPKYFPDEENPFRRTIHWCIVLGGTVVMMAGTVWAFLPGSGHGEVVEG